MVTKKVKFNDYIEVNYFDKKLPPDQKLFDVSPKVTNQPQNRFFDVSPKVTNQPQNKLFKNKEYFSFSYVLIIIFLILGFLGVWFALSRKKEKKY